jgi:hypothetical protein
MERGFTLLVETFTYALVLLVKARYEKRVGKLRLPH